MKIVFADYDGVFHPVSDLRWFTMGLPVDVCIQRGRLFRWTWILHEILEPYPDVRIVVHSSWRLLHPESKVKALLGPMSERFAGIISRDYDRAEGIAAYIGTHRLTDYRILDDHSECFPSGMRGLVVCDSETGVYDWQVRLQLQDWLNCN